MLIEIEHCTAQLSRLKDEFDVAHAHAMRGLAEGNHKAFAEAVDRQTAIFKEQGALLTKLRALKFPKGKPSQ